ncbi:MAG: phosphomethylpyrimidine synthase ThiC [Desulfosalsimonadaceae bacterium]
MTRIESARQGTITDDMHFVAASENVPAEQIRRLVAEGKLVIPKNNNRNFPARGIGKGLKTKVNANIGTSMSDCSTDGEIKKLDAAIRAGADAVMDLSTGPGREDVLAAILKRSSVMVGTVPLYNAVSRRIEAGQDHAALSAEDIFGEIEAQGKAGVDFITVHCGITRHSLAVLTDCGRLMGIVSRGGSLLAEWIAKNQAENPLYEDFDRLLEIARTYDMTLSLGDGLRPGTIFDAEDRAQVSELIILGDLTRRAVKAGVQVMVEGPGHVPLSMIANDIKQQKRLCNEAPYYVLGPLPTDAAAGNDHIAGAIGGAIAAANGADFLCYVTPAEHLALPGIEDVREGVIASKIAAHIGDLEKNVPAAWDRDRKMSEARNCFDWETMLDQALDPEKARGIRSRSKEKNRDVCSMCGDLCALKTYARAVAEHKTE